MTWWDTLAWHAYEAAVGDAPGTRARLLTGASFLTRVVALPARWADVRHSYRALIHRAERAYVIKALDGPAGACLIRTAQALHRVDAGRVTRPGESWDVMGDMLDADPPQALLVMAFGGPLNPLICQAPTVAIETPDGPLPVACFSAAAEPPVGYALFLRHGRWAYYASAATLAKDLNAALVWHGLRALETRGVRHVELGWQGAAAGQKERQIEFFRRGFGGADRAPLAAARQCGEKETDG